MRIDLALQRIKPGLKQQALLLFQLHLNAGEVPDLNWNGDSCHRGGKDRQQGHRSVDRKGPNLFWQRVMQFQARGLKSNDHQKKCGLPVNTRTAQIALYPSVHAEIDERRKGPNLFFIAAEVAQRSCQHSCAGVYRQCEPFTVKERGNRHNGAARGPATRPPNTPTRIAASNPRSAHWKFFTRKRKYTPSAKGMQVKRTKRMLRSRDRRR